MIPILQLKSLRHISNHKAFFLYIVLLSYYRAPWEHWQGGQRRIFNDVAIIILANGCSSY